MIGKKVSKYALHVDTQEAEEYRVAKYTVIRLDYYPACPTCGATIPRDYVAFCSSCGQALLHQNQRQCSRLRRLMREQNVKSSDMLK